jgi:hypothetical protein
MVLPVGSAGEMDKVCLALVTVLLDNGSAPGEEQSICLNEGKFFAESGWPPTKRIQMALMCALVRPRLVRGGPRRSPMAVFVLPRISKV